MVTVQAPESVRIPVLWLESSGFTSLNRLIICQMALIVFTPLDVVGIKYHGARCFNWKRAYELPVHLITMQIWIRQVLRGAGDFTYPICSQLMAIVAGPWIPL